MSMKVPFDVETLKSSGEILSDIESSLNIRNLCVLWVLSKSSGLTLRELQEEVESIQGVKASTYRNFSRAIMKLVEYDLLRSEMAKPKTPIRLFIGDAMLDEGGIALDGMISVLQINWNKYIGQLSKVIKEINKNTN